MLKQRILTALLLAPVVLAIIWYGNNLTFSLLVSFLALMIAYEWCQIVRNAQINSIVISVVIAICVMTFEYSGMIVIEVERIFLAAVVLWLICLFWLFKPEDGKAKSTIKYALGVGILLLFSASMLELHKSENGPLLTLLLFFLIWIADIGAYISGKTFGKHKLAKKISPGKTVEGLVGALLFTSLYGYFAAYMLEKDWKLFVLIFPLITMVSVIGDLFASLLKRHANVKDSGFLLPGHGGFLDRFDSLIAATPFYFAFISYILKDGG